MSRPLFEVLEENLRVALTVFTQAREGGEACERPGLLLACSGVVFSTFNAAVLTAPAANEAELKQRVAAASAYYRARKLPWSVWLCEDWLPRRLRSRALRIFEETGLRLITIMPGMAAERVAPADRPLPALVYRQVADEATRFAFDHIMSATFQVPFSIAREVYGSDRIWRSGMAGWVGYFNGNAVTTAATVTAGGAVGVYAVATLPAWQGKGCGEAIVRHALERARERSGLERTVLESTLAGLRLYERMGYKTVTSYGIWVSGPG